jgi:hypothetical protein
MALLLVFLGTIVVTAASDADQRPRTRKKSVRAIERSGVRQSGCDNAVGRRRQVSVVTQMSSFSPDPIEVPVNER